MLTFEKLEGKIENIDLVKKELIKRKFGYVAILDSLGTKNINSEEIFQFLRRFIFIKDLLQNPFKEYLFQTGGIDISNNNIEPEFFIFQDTVIITLEVENDDGLYYYLNYFGRLLQYYISSSFINHLLFRGALSYGEYFVYSDRFYFGEAINDASEWYEEPNLIGVMSTPKFSTFLDDLSEKLTERLEVMIGFDKEIFRESYSTTNIPTKKGSTRGWLINWPLMLAFQSSLPEDKIDPEASALSVFYSLLKRYTIPKGTEQKYINTTDFAETLFQIFPQYKEYPRPGSKGFPLGQTEPEESIND